MRSRLGPWAAAVALLWPAAAASQVREFSRFELYGGYTHWTSGRIQPRGLAGFGLAVSYAPTPWLRWVLADAGGAFGNTPLTHNLGSGPAGVHQDNLHVLTGPELTKRMHRSTMFVHGLFGYYIWGTNYLNSTGNDERGIALAVGGGVDINLLDWLAVRPIGVDYIPSRISPSVSGGTLPVPPSPQGAWYNNLRLSIGLILKSRPE